jgi:hypothetical protein
MFNFLLIKLKLMLILALWLVYPNAPGGTGQAGQTAISVGQQLIGKTTYSWGGGRSDADVKAGKFDCSGFVNYAFKQAGIDLGNGNTDTIVKKGVAVDPSQIQPGDIVFFDTYKKNGHVGIYVGNGKFIGSQSKTGVAIADMTQGYFKDKFNGVVRRVTGNTPTQTTSASNNVPMGKLAGIYGADTPTKSTKQSSYSNTWKTSKEALKSSTYQTYKQHLSSAVQSGKIPSSWVVGLTELIGRESGWNPKAGNRSSSAYGYGQFLSGTRNQYERKLGLSYDDPIGQLIMTAEYIKDRYGTPEQALAFWDKNKWY